MKRGPKPKLTEKQEKEICQIYTETDETLPSIAHSYGVCVSTIHATLRKNKISRARCPRISEEVFKNIENDYLNTKECIIDLCERYGVHYTTMYARIKERRYPQMVKRCD